MVLKRSLVLIMIGIVEWGLAQFAPDTSAVNAQIHSVAEGVRAKFCPDKRTAVWSMTPRWQGDVLFIEGETSNAEAREEFYRQVKATLKEINAEYQVVLMPEETIGENSYGIVINSVENLRSGTSVFKDLVTQTLRGLPVRILKAEDDYFLVRTDDGYLGWVEDDRLQTGNAEFLRDWLNCEKVVYTAIEGMIYSAPRRKARPVSDVVMGNRLKLIERKRRWTKVAIPDGREGFVHTRELTAEKEYLARRPEPVRILETALMMLGRPYMWGAASPKAFDCSGFTQSVFRQNGLLLLRDASMQVTEGVAIDTAGFPLKLKPADLLFFGRNSQRITHVGLYIGDYQFIHCSGRVRINSFNPEDENYSAFLRRRLQAVRRVINE